MQNSVKQITPKCINKAQRRRDALELRKVGATYSQIATALGYANAKAAQRDVAKSLRETTSEPAEQLRMVMEQQYLYQAAQLWTRASKGDLPALDRWRAIMRDIRDLRGLDLKGGDGASAELHQHHHDHGDSVLVVGGDSQSYIAALKRGVGVVDGNPGGTTYVQNESNGGD